MYFIIYGFYVIFSYIIVGIYFLYYLVGNKSLKKKHRLSLAIPPLSSSIWIHCASVGEVASCTQLITKLIETHPSYKIVITSHTNTSQYFIAKNFGDKVHHYFLPLDNLNIINKFIKCINPKLVIWLEQDFFPITLQAIKKRNIPVILLNARMSDKSFAIWIKFKFIISNILNNFTAIYPSSIEDDMKYRKLCNGKIKFIGNLKFTTIKEPSIFSSDTPLNNFIKKHKIFVALSTHNNEEVACIESYIKAKEKHNILSFVIPRHPDRVPKIMEQIYQIPSFEHLKIITYSQFLKNPCNFDVLIVDSIGIVDIFLHFADIVFVGKSLYKSHSGGHNILEPLQYGCPIVFGCYMSNFKSLVTECIVAGAGIMVHSQEELSETIVNLLDNPKKLQEMQKKVTYIFRNKTKIMEQTLNEVSQYIK